MNEYISLLSSCIKKRRKQLGINQKQLAELSETSLNFISQIERGKKTLRLNLLLNVLNVLGLEFHLRSGKEFITAEKNLL